MSTTLEFPCESNIAYKKILFLIVKLGYSLAVDLSSLFSLYSMKGVYQLLLQHPIPVTNQKRNQGIKK
jgi:hypothetical protein